MRAELGHPDRDRASPSSPPTPAAPSTSTPSSPRQKYESITDDLLERTLDPCRRCLSDAALKPEQIDEVLLVGGQTRAPKVTEVVRKVFGKEPNRTVNPDEGIAMGAAIQTGIIAGEVKELVLLDVTPHTLGIETKDGTFTPLIERNSTIPTRKSRVFTTVADNQTKVEVHVLQGESDMPPTTSAWPASSSRTSRPRPRACPRSRSRSRSTSTASCP